MSFKSLFIPPFYHTCIYNAIHDALAIAAPEQGLTYILDLKTGRRVRPAGPNDLDGEQAFARLNDLRQGDLAWAGVLVTGRKARVIPRNKDQAARRVQSVPGESVGRYKLPDSGSLPHTMVIRSAGGSHYLVTIVAIQEMGIEVQYRRLLPEKIPGYLETP